MEYGSERTNIGDKVAQAGFPGADGKETAVQGSCAPHENIPTFIAEQREIFCDKLVNGGVLRDVGGDIMVDGFLCAQFPIGFDVDLDGREVLRGGAGAGRLVSRQVFRADGFAQREEVQLTLKSVPDLTM